MKLTPYVSIIVPVHNAGIYLEKCLDTLVNQTLKNIEIICVLDCPTDGSDNYVKAIAKTDSRIIVIENEISLGVSESRNRGLKVAKGEFVGFSDHDDYRELSMYKELYGVATREDSDIVLSNTLEVCLENGNIVKRVYNDVSCEGIIKSIILPMQHSSNINKMADCIWASIFRKQVIIDNNIIFLDRHIYFGEDTLFNLMFFLKANRVSHVNKFFYSWLKHDNNLSRSCNDHFDIATRHLFLCEKMIEILHTKKYKLQQCIHFATYIRWYYRIIAENRDDFDKRLANIIKEIDYPLWGRYSDMKLISKIRIKLLFLVFRLKYLQR
ncbi:MAG: glycosyltransferase [Rikenellaceae bacterium]